MLDQTDGEPPNFWQDVDKLAIQMMTLLLPVINDAGPLYGHKWNGVEAIYQSFHEIIQHAAWLSVCIRASTSMIHFSWRLPGEPFDASQISVSDQRFQESQKLAQKADNELIKNAPNGAEVKRPMRIIRVKISILPEVTRHTPGPAKGNVVVGQRIYTLLKPQVVHYWGFLNETEDRRGILPLKEWISAKKGWWPTIEKIAVFVVIIVILLPALSLNLAPGLCTERDEEPVHRAFCQYGRIIQDHITPYFHILSQKLHMQNLVK
jgi:hypothetical protein